MKTFRDIIVIGASRGGLKAVSELVRLLPSELPAAIAVVLHTAAHSPRLLASIVGSHSALPVSYAAPLMQMRPAHIYLAPPDYHLVIVAPGVLGLDSGPKVRYSRPAVDRLFQSAAEIYGACVIGVVLTGGDGDGAAGLRAIKAAGGITVIKSPAEAEDPSMPIHALRENPDFCVSLAEMAPLLVRLATPSGREIQAAG